MIGVSLIWNAFVLICAPDFACWQVILRLRTHHQNVEAVLSMYEDITIKACNTGCFIQLIRKRFGLRVG